MYFCLIRKNQIFSKTTNVFIYYNQPESEIIFNLTRRLIFKSKTSIITIYGLK